jgi:hypothetical protein
VIAILLAEIGHWIVSGLYRGEPPVSRWNRTRSYLVGLTGVTCSALFGFDAAGLPAWFPTTCFGLSMFILGIAFASPPKK